MSQGKKLNVPVEDIIAMRDSGMKIKKISEALNVSQATIYAYLKGIPRPDKDNHLIQKPAEQRAAEASMTDLTRAEIVEARMKLKGKGVLEGTKRLDGTARVTPSPAPVETPPAPVETPPACLVVDDIVRRCVGGFGAYTISAKDASMMLECRPETGRTEETPPVRLVLTRREVELLANELSAVARHMGEKIVCEAW
jgi:DNA-binding CsgD family transcriptional regulator